MRWLKVGRTSARTSILLCHSLPVLLKHYKFSQSGSKLCLGGRGSERRELAACDGAGVVLEEM